MKRNFVWFIALALLVCGLSPVVKGQQFTIFNQAIYNPQFIIPSTMGSDGRHDVNLRNQLRRMNFEQLSHSQYLQYSAAPFNSSRTMAWGATLQNDKEFTERRFSLMVNFAYHLLNDTIKRLSVGGGIGLINLGSDYSNVPIYDPNDPLLVDIVNYTVPDAAIGMDFRLNKKKFKFELGGVVTQLPGRFVDAEVGLSLVPHVIGRAAFLYKSPDGTVNMGPLFLYKNVMLDTLAKRIGASTLDANLMFEFPQKKLWFGAGYRFNNAALNASVGLNLFDYQDTLNIRSLNLSANFEYPLGDASAFGSAFEIGLHFTFGKKDLKSKDRIKIIEVEKFIGPIWINTSNLNKYIDQQWYDFDVSEYTNENQFDDDFREMITAKTDNDDQSVILTFEYEENNLQYDLYQQDGARKLVDIIINKVIPECLHPAKRDSQPIPDSLEAVDYVSLSSKFAFDSAKANTETAIKFGGDWDMAVLEEPYIKDGEEVYSHIVQGENVTNLELALLKLISLKKRFEGDPKARDKIVPLMISSDNPGQKIPLSTRITIGFRKYKDR